MILKPFLLITVSLLLSSFSYSCVYSGCGCTGCYRVLDLTDTMGYQPVEKKPKPNLLEEEIL